jgi:ribonucleotide reductase beta subunit family protein with ferritin-like domain
MYAMFPITHQNLWELYKKAVASFWTVEEVDLSKDVTDWENLSGDEKHFISRALAFFAGADGIVFDNIDINFAQEVEWTEAKAFYGFQGAIEMIHSEMYSLMLEKLIQDQTQKNKLFNAIETIPAVAKKARWAEKYFSRKYSFSERLIAFACVEGIFFSGSFCSIFWLKKKGIMPGLCFSNELISRDEGLHLEFAIELFNTIGERPSTKVIHSIVKDAVAIEKEFIIDSLPCKLIGMDSDKMSQYIEYVADRILKQLGYMTIWDTEIPFDWMESISLEGKTNFFEKRVGEYSKHMDTSDVSFKEDF